jgi:hypothetical protein
LKDVSENDGQQFGRKRGRPRKGVGNDSRLEVRIGPEERAAIEHMLIESDKSKSELVRKALMMYYRTNRGRW